MLPKLKQNIKTTTYIDAKYNLNEFILISHRKPFLSLT